MMWIGILILILMSCSTPAEKQASLIVPSDAEPRVLSDLSELIDSMTYIPLEINDDCVLGHVQTARMCDDRILVKDDKGLFVFNRDGKFLFQVGRNGRGPSEHLGIQTFYYNEFSKEFGILSSGSTALLIYDDIGTFKRSYKLDYVEMFSYAMPISESSVLVAYSLRNEYRPFKSQVSVMTFGEGDTVLFQEWVPNLAVSTGYSEYSPLRSPLAEYDGRFYAASPFSNDLSICSPDNEPDMLRFGLTDKLIGGKMLEDADIHDFWGWLQSARSGGRSAGITALFADEKYIYAEINNEYILITDTKDAVTIALPLIQDKNYYMSLGGLGFKSSMGVITDFNEDGILKNPTVYYSDFKEGILTSK